MEEMSCVELQNRLFNRLIERLDADGFTSEQILKILIYLMD